MGCQFVGADGAGDVGVLEQMDHAQCEQFGIAWVDNPDCVSEMVLPLENDKFPKVKGLFVDEQMVVLDDMYLGGWVIAQFSHKRVDSVLVGVGIEKECNFLSNWYGDNKISRLLAFKFEHVLVELMSVVAAGADFKLPRVKFILSLPELFGLPMVNLLGLGEFLFLHHFLVLLLSLFLFLLHLLHSIFVGYFGFLLHLFEVLL